MTVTGTSAAATAAGSGPSGEYLPFILGDESHVIPVPKAPLDLDRVIGAESVAQTATLPSF